MLHVEIVMERWVNRMFFKESLTHLVMYLVMMHYCIGGMYLTPLDYCIGGMHLTMQCNDYRLRKFSSSL